jgi:hypothetical protein
MKRIAWIFAAAVLTGSVAAQTPSPQERAAAIKESVAKNQASLKQYSWVETTEISLKGEVKKKEQKQCSYGADGKVQKTPIPGAAPAAAPPAQQSGGRRGGGRAKQAIVENKVEDLKDYMEKVAALVQEYVPPAPDKIQAAQAAGSVSALPAGGIAIANYVKPDDLLSIGFDMTAKKITTYKVNSYVEKPKEDEVTLSVTFGRLADGTSYPQETVLKAAAKNVQVKVTNSGYKKAGA